MKLHALGFYVLLLVGTLALSEPTRAQSDQLTSPGGDWDDGSLTAKNPRQDRDRTMGGRRDEEAEESAGDRIHYRKRGKRCSGSREECDQDLRHKRER